jgi:hypothetical protein
MRPENASFSTRMTWYFRHAISSLFGITHPCRYISYNCQSVMGHGYLVMDYIETTDAEMLSESWDKFHFSKPISHHTRLKPVTFASYRVLDDRRMRCPYVDKSSSGSSFPFSGERRYSDQHTKRSYLRNYRCILYRSFSMP